MSNFFFFKYDIKSTLVFLCTCDFSCKHSLLLFMTDDFGGVSFKVKCRKRRETSQDHSGSIRDHKMFKVNQRSSFRNDGNDVGSSRELGNAYVTAPTALVPI